MKHVVSNYLLFLLWVIMKIFTATSAHSAFVTVVENDDFLTTNIGTENESYITAASHLFQRHSARRMTTVFPVGFDKEPYLQACAAATENHHFGTTTATNKVAAGGELNASATTTQRYFTDENADCLRAWNYPASEFCTFQCNLLSTITSSNSSEPGGMFSISKAMAHNHRLTIALESAAAKFPQSMQNPPQATPVELLVMKARNSSYYEQLGIYSKDLVTVYELTATEESASRWLSEQLVKAVSHHEYIAVDIQDQHNCRNTILDLLQWLHRPVFVIWDNFDVLVSVEISRRRIFLSAASLTLPTLQYFRMVKLSLLQSLTKYNMQYAQDHDQVAMKCAHLLPSAANTNTSIHLLQQFRSNKKAAGSNHLVAHHYVANNSLTDKPPKEPFKIIIARCPEPLENVSSLFGSYPHLIINRGSINDSYPGLNLLYDDKNSGRESSAYSKFIVDNYENLPGMMWFTQADPRHCRSNPDSEKMRHDDLQFLFQSAGDDSYRSYFRATYDGFALLGRYVYYGE